MQIGFDVGATKIESVVLEDTGQEIFIERTACPKIKGINE
jgi:fructokinase